MWRPCHRLGCRPGLGDTSEFADIASVGAESFAWIESTTLDRLASQLLALHRDPGVVIAPAVSDLPELVNIFLSRLCPPLRIVDRLELDDRDRALKRELGAMVSRLLFVGRCLLLQPDRAMLLDNFEHAGARRDAVVYKLLEDLVEAI
jgi:hypothetical protein